MYRITFALSGPHVGRGVCLATCAAKVVRGILVADCIGIRFKYIADCIGIRFKYIADCVGIRFKYIADCVGMLIQGANVRQTNVYLSYNHP